MFPFNLKPNGDMEFTSINVGNGLVKSNVSGKIAFGDSSPNISPQPTFPNCIFINGNVSDEVEVITFATHGLRRGTTVVFANISMDNNSTGVLKNKAYVVERIVSRTRFVVLVPPDLGVLSGSVDVFVNTAKMQIGNSADDDPARETKLSIYADNTYIPAILGNNESTLMITNNNRIANIPYTITDSVMSITLTNHGYQTNDVIKINHPTIKAVDGKITKINDNLFSIGVEPIGDMSGTDMAFDDGCSINLGMTNINSVSVPQSRIKGTANRFEVECYRPTNRDVLCTYQENKYEAGFPVIRGTPVSQRNIGFDINILAITFSGTEFVALFGDSVYITSTGINWIRNKVFSTSRTWNDLVYTKNVYIGVSDIIVISFDTLTWFTTTSPIDIYRGVALSDDIIVVVGSNGIVTANVSDISPTMVWSSDGVNSLNKTFTGVVFGSNRFVASTTTGILYSNDGKLWLEANVAQAFYSSVTFGNGIYVAVSSNGSIRVSSNGIDWGVTLAFSDPLSSVPGFVYSYRRVRFGGGLFVASTTNGIRISVDGVTWEDKLFTGSTNPLLPSPFTTEYSGISFGKNTFLVMGMEGRVATFRIIIEDTLSVIIPIPGLFSSNTPSKLYLDVLSGKGSSQLYDVSTVINNGNSTELVVFDPNRPIRGNNMGGGSVSLTHLYSRSGKTYTVFIRRIIAGEFSDMMVGDMVYIMFTDRSDNIPSSSSFRVTHVNLVNNVRISFDIEGPEGPNVINKECIVLRAGFQSRFTMFPDGRVGFNVVPRDHVGMDISGDIRVGGGLYIRSNIQSIPQEHTKSGDFVIGEEGKMLDVFLPAENQADSWVYSNKLPTILNSIVTSVSTAADNSIIISSIGDVEVVSFPSPVFSKKGFIRKTDINGVLLWEISITSMNIVLSATADKNTGDVYVIAISNLPNFLIEGSDMTGPIVLLDKSNCMLFKFDSNGFLMNDYIQFRSTNDLYPMGLDISVGNHFTVAFAGRSRVDVWDKNNTPLPRNIIDFGEGVQDITDGNKFNVSVIKLTKDLSSVIGDAAFTTNITTLKNLGFIESQSLLSVIKEGVVRYDTNPINQTAYLTFPAEGTVKMYHFNDEDNFVPREIGTIGNPYQFNGSICIGLTGEFRFRNISMISSMRRGSGEGIGSVITTSIDTDRGFQGDSVGANVYICGTCEGSIIFSPLIRFGNQFLEGPITSTRISSRRGAFLCKLLNTGFLDWFSMIDGNDEEEAVSVSVNPDVQDSSKGVYGIYVLGSFTSVSANVFDSRKGTLNRADTSITPAATIIKSLKTDFENQREAYILKFDQDGKFILTYKTSTSERITPVYLDVGQGDNVVACYKTSFINAFFKEPDGRVAAALNRSDLRELGVVIKYRTTNNLVLIPPSSPGFNLKKRIVNKSPFSLYLEAYRRDNGLEEVFSSVFVVPGQTSLLINYVLNDWYPSASDRLASSLISLDTDNGKFGFGINNPISTLDVAGDINVDGLFSTGSLNVKGETSVRNVLSLSSLNAAGDLLVNDNQYLPSGVILIWSGTANNIPDGWAMCDGSVRNGVTLPDLRGRFVLGYNQVTQTFNQDFNSDFSPAGTTYEAQANSIGEVSGVQSVILDQDQLPRHNHVVPYRGEGTTTRASNTRGGSGSIIAYNQSTRSAGGDIIVVNNIQFIVTKFHNNMPPYYALMYIIKL